MDSKVLVLRAQDVQGFAVCQPFDVMISTIRQQTAPSDVGVIHPALQHESRFAMSCLVGRGQKRTAVHVRQVHDVKTAGTPRCNTASGISRVPHQREHPVREPVMHAVEGVALGKHLGHAVLGMNVR